MPIRVEKKVIVFEEFCTIEEAETLLEALTTNPKLKVSLKRCAHLHTALFQVLLATKAQIQDLAQCPAFVQKIFAAAQKES